ncbi:MAG: hypothetical protein ACLUIQ_11225 [Dialister invisus]
MPRRESIHGQGAVGYCRTGMLPIVSRRRSIIGKNRASAERGAGTVFLRGATCPASIARIMKYLNCAGG